MTLERAEQVRRVFGLRDFPHKMPYDADIGLDLPDYLTSKEVRQIAAAAACPVVSDGPWYIGDLLNWLQAHPDQIPSADWVKQRFFRVGRYTQRTFDNYCSVARTFPLKERIQGLSFRHHDALRAKWLPAKVRAELFDMALRDSLSPVDLANEREIRRRELEGSDKYTALRSELYASASELYRLTRQSEDITNDESLREVLKSLDRLAIRFRKMLDKRREGEH